MTNSSTERVNKAKMKSTISATVQSSHAKFSKGEMSHKKWLIILGLQNGKQVMNTAFTIEIKKP